MKMRSSQTNKRLSFSDALHASKCKVYLEEEDEYRGSYNFSIKNSHMTMSYLFQHSISGNIEKFEMMVHEPEKKTLDVEFVGGTVTEWRIDDVVMSPHNQLALRSYKVFQILNDVRVIIEKRGFR